MSEHIKRTRRQTTVTANDIKYEDARGSASPVTIPNGGAVTIIPPLNALEIFIRPAAIIDVKFAGETGEFRAIAEEFLTLQIGSKGAITLSDPGTTGGINVWFGFNLGSVY